MDVLGLLRSKNRCLLRFLEASKSFLVEAQSQGTLPSLSEFETQREAILKAIGLFDRKISDAIPHISKADRTPELIQAVEKALTRKDEIMKDIIIADEKVLRLVEEEKNRITKELVTSQKSRQVLQKFKSSWVNESGEEIDQSL
jgi:hypothetical protein